MLRKRTSDLEDYSTGKGCWKFSNDVPTHLGTSIDMTYTIRI